MSLEKSTAIVLRVTDFSETSCVVTLMTREFGKITALAKGARRRKNPFEAALDVLAICRIVFLHKSSNAMDLLTEAKLERRFRTASTDLPRLYSGYYVIELLRTLTEENDPHPELFDLAHRTIVDLDDTLLTGDELKLRLLNFEIQTLKFLGHLPMLSKCVGCGRERKTENRVSFGLNAGGLLCQQCRPGQSDVVMVSPRGVRLLSRLVGEEGRNFEFEKDRDGDAMMVRENATEAQGDETELNEARRLMSNYITHLQGFAPRLHKYLKNL